ncbi:hypothetical protein EJD97_024841 [Solanum chilense]|uniref:Retrotransposon gag domain-containing protein n=1 Tax=Solanum chilense TaxID=4083 RepID=A0A6N2ASB2_SOLCI|nr:hypothetical protein EJD97_024841 [Solanum chilense]
MVRTRATTVPTLTPARQDASEPATGAVAQRGAVERCRGRGRGRTSSRGRGQKPGPTSTMAVTPPPTDEEEREGEEGENEQGQAPPVFSALTPQILGVQHAAAVAPRMDASLEIGTFLRLTTGPITTSDQHELFTKFLKLKPPVFKGGESEDAYDFLVDCHELLHKMGIVERFGVEFVTYQFQRNAKMW